MSGTGRVPGVTRHAMVGRDAEVARLKVMARDAAAGRGGLVLIEGEPGIGKTLLLRTALGSADGLFPRVVTGAAEEFDQRLPFATVHSCLEPLEGGDRRVAEILALVRRGSMEYPVIESVLSLVEEWCAASAVAVAVDDMHWADAASLLLLHRLGRIAQQLPLLLAATCRSGASRPDVDALTRSWRGHGAVQIMLGPLPEQAVTQLVADLAGGRPGPVLRGLVNGTGGNPLYINELVGGLAQRMRLHGAGEVVDVEPGADRQAVSVTLGVAIAQRLGYLSAQTRELLQVAALLGTAFNLADVAAVLDRPVTHLLSCVREAAEGGVLTALPDRLAFRHPLIRAVLDDELPMSARQALQLQAAQALATRASSDRVAEHLLAAGSAAAPMVPWLAEAADDLVGRAPALAAEVLGQMLETVPPAATEVSIRLRAAHAAALLRAGQPGPAEQAARSALAEPLSPRTEAALRWTLASACASQGAMDRAVHETRVALATGRLTLGEQARFYGLEAQCHVTRSHPADAAAAQQKSISAAQTSGDTEAIAYGMAAAARARAWDGWVDEALICADVSITATRALGPRAGRQLAPQLYRGICLAELDRDADAEQAFEEALRMAEGGIGTDFLPFRYNCTAWLRFCQGRWDEALAEVQSGLDFPDAFDIARHLHGLAALIAVHRRDRAALLTSLPFLRAPVLPNTPARQSVHAPSWALALAAHSEGRTGEAATVLGAAWGPHADDDQLRFQRHHLVPDLVALSMAAGDQAAAQRIAASITSYADKRSAPALRRSARHARALASHDAAGLAEVAEEQQAAERRLFAAQAWEQAAELLAAEGQVRDARAALLGAAASYEALEAGWDLARAETLLRTLGIRRGIRGPRRRPKTGWDALTDAERIVADLVTEGLSNPAIAARLYLSRRTVQGHVSSILGKLGAASRVELATMVIRHGAASS